MQMRVFDRQTTCRRQVVTRSSCVPALKSPTNLRPPGEISALISPLARPGENSRLAGGSEPRIRASPVLAIDRGTTARAMHLTQVPLVMLDSLSNYTETYTLPLVDNPQ